jgi:hypothetical protein
VVRDNKNADGSKTGATWVTLLEINPAKPEVKGQPFRHWYTDYLVRGEDVRKVVKNHIDFLKSFGVSKDDITIEDQREGVSKASASSGDTEGSDQPGA